MSFKENFFAWSMAMSAKTNAKVYEEGDKLILPQNLLLTLKPDEDGSPFYFKLTNPVQNLSLHVGVVEFSALEGNCHIPYWIMSQLVITEGSPVNLELVPKLPAATLIRLKPQGEGFFEDMSDPKAFLEVKLRKFTCLNKDSWLCLTYLGERKYFDVIDTQPSSAVSLINTDCTLEFEIPNTESGKTEVQETKLETEIPTVEREALTANKPRHLQRFPGKGYRLGSE